MNIRCTGCGAVFRVDPDKVPERGIRARCSVCSEVFWVRRETDRAPAGPPPLPPPAAPPWPEVVSPPFRPAVGGERRGSVGGAGLATVGPATPPAPAGIGLAPVPARPEPEGRAIQAPAPRVRTNPFLAQDPAARARRLARALVSDIVVYNPAKRRDALRDGSLKVRFEDEIRKSWDEYVDQIGRELAESTPYFTDALNEILADGRKLFS